MEDIEIFKIFFASQTLLAIIILGTIIATIIKTKHEIINTWIFKMMLIVECFAVLLIINIVTFDSAIIYHINAVLAVIMIITVPYLLKKDFGQITKLPHEIK